MILPFGRSIALLLLIATVSFAANKREEQIRNDIKEVGDDPTWVYNDLDKGLAEAKKQSKPMLIVFRCVP